MTILKIENLKKYFDGKEILRGINLEVEKGEVISFIGASGGGKSTLLRCINLLEDYDFGNIYYKGQNIKDKGFKLTDYRREVGMIFQGFNLFKNLNVIDNLCLGQEKVLGRSKEEACEIAMENLKKVGMEDHYKKGIGQLSGGQCQRVAIARALCMEPEILLLDEPTSALDPMMVQEVLAVIKDLADTGISLLMVTHEMKAARDISDRLVFLKEGKIHEEGKAKDLFENPKTEELKKYLAFEGK